MIIIIVCCIRIGYEKGHSAGVCDGYHQGYVKNQEEMDVFMLDDDEDGLGMDISHLTGKIGEGFVYTPEDYKNAQAQKIADSIENAHANGISIKDIGISVEEAAEAVSILTNNDLPPIRVNMDIDPSKIVDFKTKIEYCPYYIVRLMKKPNKESWCYDLVHEKFKAFKADHHSDSSKKIWITKYGWFYESEAKVVCKAEDGVNYPGLYKGVE